MQIRHFKPYWNFPTAFLASRSCTDLVDPQRCTSDPGPAGSSGYVGQHVWLQSRTAVGSVQVCWSVYHVQCGRRKNMTNHSSARSLQHQGKQTGKEVRLFLLVLYIHGAAVVLLRPEPGGHHCPTALHPDGNKAPCPARPGTEKSLSSLGRAEQKP